MPVQIYADQDIAGISNIDTLQGLLVGVKAGDACGEVLRGQSILVDGRYDNYQGHGECRCRRPCARVLHG